MTLAVGLQGKDHVVMAADRLGHTDDPEGMYRFKCQKLHAIRAGSREWLVGVAGSEDALTLIDALSGEPFDAEYAIDGLQIYTEKLKDTCERSGFENDMYFLIGGVDPNGPFIYELRFRGEKKNWVGPVSVGDDRGYSAIGAAAHGALYFASEHHSPEMSKAQRLQLAHFCVAEASKQDIRIDGPVEVAVASSEAIQFITEASHPHIAERSKSIARSIRELLCSPYPEPGHS